MHLDVFTQKSFCSISKILPTPFFSDGLIKREKLEQEKLQFSSWWPICFYHFQNGVEWILVIQLTPQYKITEPPDGDVLFLMPFSPNFLILYVHVGCWIEKVVLI
jgi:hypothetical protein